MIMDFWCLLSLSLSLSLSLFPPPPSLSLSSGSAHHHVCMGSARPQSKMPALCSDPQTWESSPPWSGRPHCLWGRTQVRSSGKQLPLPRHHNTGKELPTTHIMCNAQHFNQNWDLWDCTSLKFWFLHVYYILYTSIIVGINFGWWFLVKYPQMYNSDCSYMQ